MPFPWTGEPSAVSRALCGLLWAPPQRWRRARHALRHESSPLVQKPRVGERSGSAQPRLHWPGSGWERQRVRAPARRLPGRLLRLRSAGRGEAPAAFCTRPAIPPSPRGARAPRPSSRAGQAQVTGTLFFMSGVGLRYFISKESLSGGTCFHIREGLHPQRRSMAGSAAVLV